MIISMNFQHIVKRKTKLMTGNINALNGYRAVEIYPPSSASQGTVYHAFKAVIGKTTTLSSLT